MSDIKKEIERYLAMEVHEGDKWHAKPAKACIIHLSDQIESLKAITELKNVEIADLKAEMVSVGKVAAIGLKKNDPYDMKLSLQAIEMAVDHAQT